LTLISAQGATGGTTAGITPEGTTTGAATTGTVENTTSSQNQVTIIKPFVGEIVEIGKLF